MRFQSDILTVTDAPTKKMIGGKELVNIECEERDGKGNPQHYSIAYIGDRATFVPDSLVPGDRFIAYGTVRGKRGNQYGSFISLYGNGFFLAARGVDNAEEGSARMSPPTEPKPAEKAEEPDVIDDDLPF